MSAHEIVIWIMAAFAVLGALDRIFGNRFGLGQEFENGILAMGSLAMAMVGIIVLAPVLANVLRPVVVPVFRFLGADPAEPVAENPIQSPQHRKGSHNDNQKFMDRH